MQRLNWNRSQWLLPSLFLFARLILLLGQTPDSLRGYGDFVHFYRLAQMGRPFLDYWVEFPPIFPFFSRLILSLAGGRQHVYEYLLALGLSVLQAGSLHLFIRLAQDHLPEGEAERRAWVYFSLLVPLAYSWWYFDPLAVFAMLLGIYWMLKGKDVRAAVALALGMLTKWFPVLALPAAWRLRSVREAFRVTLISAGLVLLVWGLLYLRAPQMTLASLVSQVQKGSWQTLWALIDGNFGTGNFGPELERLDPALARVPQGNSARLPSLLTFVVFVGLGGLAFLRDRRPLSPLGAISLTGFAWSLFLLWSPGWSPQWILYLLPLILLTLPFRLAVLLSALLLIINLLEWPVLLSRGYFDGLWITVPIRTGLFVLLAVLWYRQLRTSEAIAPA